MLDIGWTEMFVVAVVAILVIGPKESPRALRTAGQWARKARNAAREFQNSIDEMVNQAELDELRKSANEIRNFDASSYMSNSIDPTGPSLEEQRKKAEASTTSAAAGGDEATSSATNEQQPIAPAAGGGAEGDTTTGDASAAASEPERKANA